MITGKDDDAASIREDSFLAELVPQAAEHLAGQHAGDYNAEDGRTRFQAWLAGHTERLVVPAPDEVRAGTRHTREERIHNGTRALRFPGAWFTAFREGLRRVPAPEPVVPTDQGISPSLARRVLDIAVAVAILGLVWPVFLGLAVATRLSTGGTAIYGQRRVGQSGIPFTLYKFRTMRARMTGSEVTAPGDDRLTRLGALMRKTNIDELPQMVNVLLGHMTLVGPRAESVALAKRYPEELRFVFRYRPGVTGPGRVLVHDDEKVLRLAADREKFYLTELVPHRVDMDMDYLKDPTLARTVQWLIVTVVYLVRTAKPQLGTDQPESAEEASTRLRQDPAHQRGSRT